MSSKIQKLIQNLVDPYPKRRKKEMKGKGKMGWKIEGGPIGERGVSLFILWSRTTKKRRDFEALEAAYWKSVIMACEVLMGGQILFPFSTPSWIQLWDLDLCRYLSLFKAPSFIFPLSS